MDADDDVMRHVDAARAAHVALGRVLARIECTYETHAAVFAADLRLAERYAAQLSRALLYARHEREHHSSSKKGQ